MYKIPVQGPALVTPQHSSSQDIAGPLLFVLDEAPLQHKILNFGLFQAKTYANGL